MIERVSQLDLDAVALARQSDEVIDTLIALVGRNHVSWGSYKVSLIRPSYCIKTWRYRETWNKSTIESEEEYYRYYLKDKRHRLFLCPSEFKDGMIIQPALDDVGVIHYAVIDALDVHFHDSGPQNWGWLNGRPVIFDFAGHA